MKTKPLSGVKVLDLSRVLAGPFSTQILGDLGAEIIKVEAPDLGDEVRYIPPFYPGGESHYFMAINRNKRSLVIDLKRNRGRQIVLDLAAHCDLVVENFRPGVMDRLGLGFEALKDVNSSIIMISISGFGANGPLVAKPAFDLVTQARSGVMSITGEPDGPPNKMGLPMGDLGGGLWATIAALAALYQRQEDATAQHIDLSLLDGLIGLLGYLGQYSLLTGEVPERVGSNHHQIVPYGRFEVKDGYLVLALHVGPFWRRFCEAIDRRDLADDERFKTADARLANREALQEAVEEIMRRRSRSEWEEILDAGDVPYAPILNVNEALGQDQVRARRLLQTFKHPTAGEVRVVGSPLRTVDEDKKGQGESFDPPPLLGQHTRAILSEIAGYGDDDISRLIADEVVEEYGSVADDRHGSEHD